MLRILEETERLRSLNSGLERLSASPCLKFEDRMLCKEGA